MKIAGTEQGAPMDTATTELADVKIRVGDRGQIDFAVAPVAGRDAFFCLGVRKSGSTLLNKIVINLARRNNIHAIDVPGAFFKNGFKVADWMGADLTEVVKPGNLYLGFRSYPKNFEAYEPYRLGRKIFMFRDPRDALVSQYFSDAYSHSLPSANTEAAEKAKQDFLKKRAEALEADIEKYVLDHAPGFQRTLMEFEPLLKDPACLTVRYEDYIFQKRRLISKILKHFEWESKPGQIDQILNALDEVPGTEDKTKFVRAVVPGDHRRKLKPETIRKLDNRLAKVLSTFDYA
jgi:hypothetical protein